MNFQSVTLLHPISWIMASWRCLLANFGGWLLLTLMFLVGTAALLITPLIGFFVLVLLNPLLTAGLLHAAGKCCQQQLIHLEDLGYGFTEKSRRLRLFVLGLLMLGYVFALVLALYPLSGAIYQNLYALGEPVPMSLLGYYFLHSHPLLTWLQSLAILAGIAGFGHSVVLVSEGGCSPLHAISLSAQAFITNIAPMSLLILCGALLLFFSTFAFGLGVLITLPLACMINYCSYHDIYAPPPAATEQSAASISQYPRQ